MTLSALGSIPKALEFRHLALATDQLSAHDVIEQRENFFSHGRRDRCGFERREVRGQIVCNKLKEMFSLTDALQVMPTQIAQSRALWQLLEHLLCHIEREQDLSAMAARHNALHASQCEVTSIPAFMSFGKAGVQPHADFDGRGRPGFTLQ